MPLLGVDVSIVTVGGWRYRLTTAGAESYTPGSLAPAWNWAGAWGARWARFWVLVHGGWEPGPAIGDPDLWDGAIGTPGFTIGSTYTLADIAIMRAVIADWKMAGSRCDHIILCPGDAEPVPDGTWDKPANRDPSFRYIPGNL